MTHELQVIVRRYPSGGTALDEILVVGTAEQVGALVSMLGQDEIDDAYVTHLGRPTKVDELEDEETPDHVMYLAVRDTPWGYVRYIGTLPGQDEAEAYVPLGDPRSPATHGTYNTDYEAGSGLPLEVFERAVTEFLMTKELPTCVRWASEDQ